MKYPEFTGYEPCATADPELWFTDDKNNTIWLRATIGRICGACPMFDDCREWGIRHEKYGWWGGLSPMDRVRYRRTHGIVLESIDHSVFAPPVNEVA